MTVHTDSVQILNDAKGQPAFAVIPIADYQALVRGKEPGIPADVAELAIENDISAARAWREYLGLTQAEVASRIKITQGAYAQLESKKKISKKSRIKIAAALDINESQLDF